MLDGEQLIEHVPAGMAQPTQTTAATNLVLATRFWRTGGTITATYRELKAKRPVGLRLSGYGSPSAAASKPPQGELDFLPPGLPRWVADANVFVEVRNDGSDGSFVGAFAQVVPYPAKPAAEQIPTSRITARLTRSILRYRRATRQQSVTLDEGAAAALARAMNALHVWPPGAHSCPVLLSAHPMFRVSFTSEGHVWVVTNPGGNCVTQVDVTLDRRHLPTLMSTRQFGEALALAWRQTAG